LTTTTINYYLQWIKNMNVKILIPRSTDINNFISYFICIPFLKFQEWVEPSFPSLDDGSWSYGSWISTCLSWLCFLCKGDRVIVFNVMKYSSYIMAVSFIGWGNHVWKKHDQQTLTTSYLISSVFLFWNFRNELNLVFLV
jgi:hypothetical protein